MNAFKDFSPTASGDSYENYVSDTIAKKYEVSYEHPEEPEEDETIEILQDLLNLGFLDYEGISDLSDIESPEDWNFLKKCIIRYLKEDTLLLGEFGWTSYHLNHDAILKERLTTIRHRLSVLTSLDGELSYRGSLILGSRNLYTRILHHRLKILNQYEGKVSSPISEHSILVSHRLPLIVGDIDLQTFQSRDFSKIDHREINFLGNVKKILKIALDKNKKDILTFREHNDSRIPFDQVVAHPAGFVAEKSDKEFKKELRRNGLNRTSVKRKLTSRSEPETMVYDQRNQLTLELLQVILWMKSYYRDRLDFIWGTQSTMAFLEFLSFEAVDSRNFIQPIKGNYALINVPGLRQLLSPYFDDDASEDEKELYIENRLEEVENVEKKEKQIEEIQKKKKGFFGRLWKGVKGVSVKIYNGVREGIDASVRWLKKAGNWLKEKVIGPAITFFKNVIKKLREGIRQFFVGFKRLMHFLFRKPVVTPSTDDNGHVCLIITKFDFDNDAINYVPTSSAIEDRKKHSDLIDQLTDNLQLFIKIVMTVIDLFKSLIPPLGWIKLGFKIYRLIKSILKGTFSTKFSF